MTWFREFGILELVFGGLFIFFYLLYVFRIRRLAGFFNRKGYLVWVKFGIRTAYFSFLMLALLGPSFGDTQKEVKSIGKDIYLAIDLSRSMDATDVAPTRLQKAVFELTNLVKELNSDRIGLIIFTTEAFVQCPLTHDQGALLLFLKSLNTNLVTAGGTNMGSALELARQKLTPEKKAKDKFAKAVVVVTDGEDFGDFSERQALALARNNITLFVLGVGTETGGTIPEGDGVKKTTRGEPVITRLNNTEMRDLVRKAGGAYFELSNTKNEMPRLLRSINQLQGQLRATQTVDVAANKYVYPLAAALLLIAFDVLITFTVIKV